jgi:uncharacterized membrane protein YbhN (UPF0104 family)
MKALTLIGKLAVSLAVLWFVTRFVDWSLVAARLADADLWPMAAAVLCLVVQGVLATLRWRQVVRALGADDPGLGKMLASYFEALFLGQVLPSTVGGDVLRGLHARAWGHTLAQAASAVILERVFALAALVALGIAGMPGLWTRHVPNAELAVATLVVAAWGGAVAGLLLVPVLPSALQRLPLVRDVFGMAMLAHKMLRHARSTLNIALTSLGGHGLVFAAVWLLAKGLHLDLGFGAVVLAMPVVILVQMIPISLAGWGIREGAMAFVLRWFGVDASDAVLLSVLIGLAVIVSSLPGLAAWLGSLRAADARSAP